VHDTIDVLVAGAGPVGLTAAYELVRRGVRVRVIDAAAGPATTSRAIATHPRTLETYDQMGIVDEMIARGLVVQAFTMFSNGKRLIRLDADYTASPTQFPFTVAIDQVFTEAVLREALSGLGVEVEWNTALASFTETSDGVAIRTGDGAEIVASWLVGCDGGHSTVRKLLGLPLTGDANETWLIADSYVDTDLPRNSIYWIHTSSGTLMMAPLPGDRRWRMLDTVEVDYDGDAAAIAARFTRKLSAGTGTTVAVDAPGWVSVFTAQQRMVPSMQRGRVFVAGDAAHVHSPASGQGMNTGIQEAYNLAWKLAMVVRGEADPALLDTFSDERVPIGRQLLGSTKNATRMVALKNRMASIMLPIVFGVMRRVPPMRVRAQRTALGQVSGLNLGYPTGPLTGADRSDARPAPGERVRRITIDGSAPGWQALRTELRDTRWTLLVFDAGGSDLAQPWLSVRTVGETGDLADPGNVLRDALGGQPGGWILIRPDGYVASRGTTLTPDVLQAALAPAAVIANSPIPALA
jgi:6-methylpretetramide 4-monooxygenase / 4-hydroxy-6-methylpretetramide 12a-monooxygenase